jgi:hypothetical protein
MSQMNKMNHFGASHIYGQLLQVADAAEARLRFFQPHSAVFSRVQPHIYCVLKDLLAWKYAGNAIMNEINVGMQ